MGVSEYEAITVSTVAIGITETLTDNQQNFALVTCEDAAIRFRLDGTAPTSTEGHIMEDGDVLELDGNEVRGFQAIRKDGADATLRVSVGGR